MGVLKLGCTSTSYNSPVCTAVIKLSAFADASSSSPQNNSELEYEQDHEYFLNKLSFSTWRSCKLSAFVQVSELFLLLRPRFLASVLV